MGKSKGTNAKKEAGNARKAEAAARKAQEQARKDEATEAERWSKGAKNNDKKSVLFFFPFLFFLLLHIHA